MQGGTLTRRMRQEVGMVVTGVVVVGMMMVDAVYNDQGWRIRLSLLLLLGELSGPPLPR